MYRSLSQDCLPALPVPATIRRRSTRSPVQGDQFRSSETSKDDNKDIDPVQGNLLRGLPEWLEDITEIPVDEGVSASRGTPASNSHESDLERPTKLYRGRTISLLIPRDRNCEVCKRTKITRALCRKRTCAENNNHRRAVRRIKEGTSAVLVQSGLDENGGLILWNAIAICKMFRTSYQTGKHLMKRDLENHAKIEYHHLFSAEDQSRHHQFGKKVLEYSSDIASFARKIWKGDILVADIEELDTLDASDIHARRLNAKRGNDAQKGVNTFFPIADGTAKLFGRNYGVREPTPRRKQLARSEDVREELQGNSERSQPTDELAMTSG